MPTNWTTPTGPQVAQVIQLAVMAKANENIDDNSVAASQTGPQPIKPVAFDPTLEDRAGDLVNQLVAQVRETIQNLGRQAISVTAGAVPPKSALHVLNIAAFQLVSSTPNLQMVIMNDKAVYSPLQVLWKAGQEYIKSLENGAPVMTPSDPTGIDYLTAVSATNPAVSGVQSLPMNSEIDLSTDGSPGGRTYGGQTNPNGVQWGFIGDIYRQVDVNGNIIKLWEKIFGWGTLDGWV